MPEVRGRADMLFGAMVFEFKSDLRREIPDAERQLTNYLGERERELRRRFLGIATDGATLHRLRIARRGAGRDQCPRELRADRPEALLAWLGTGAFRTRRPACPTRSTVQRELGRDSLTFGRARGVLERIWAALHDAPGGRAETPALGRAAARGVRPGGRRRPLFLQHTYLTIVAKTIAARVLRLATDRPPSILSGHALTQEGIHGAVESDFFDWALQHPTASRWCCRLPGRRAASGCATPRWTC